MKMRIVDKIFVALCGLVVLLLGAGMAAELFFGAKITPALTKLLSGENIWLSVAAVGIMLLCVIMAVCCFAAMLRRRVSNHGFVSQRTESGELSISIRAIESLVQKCVDKHDDLDVNDMMLSNTRDGLLIRLRVGMGEGVNIPLAVSALQKQIKQYVTACSGVDVREVRVQVENTAADLAKSVYAVPEMLENVPEATLLEEQAAAEAPAEAKEEKLLHQRLFGMEEQPAIVPEPPVEAPAEEQPADEAAAAADEAAPAWDEAAAVADEAAPAWDEAAAEADAAEMVAEIDLSVLDVADVTEAEAAPEVDIDALLATDGEDSIVLPSLEEDCEAAAQAFAELDSVDDADEIDDADEVDPADAADAPEVIDAADEPEVIDEADEVVAEDWQ